MESRRVAGTQIEKLSYDSLRETPPVILYDSVQFGFTWITHQAAFACLICYRKAGFTLKARP